MESSFSYLRSGNNKFRRLTVAIIEAIAGIMYITIIISRHVGIFIANSLKK